MLAASDVTVDVVRLPFYAALLPLALWIGERRALPSANTGWRFVARRDGDRCDPVFPMPVKATALVFMVRARASYAAGGWRTTRRVYENRRAATGAREIYSCLGSPTGHQSAASIRFLVGPIAPLFRLSPPGPRAHPCADGSRRECVRAMQIGNRPGGQLFPGP